MTLPAALHAQLRFPTPVAVLPPAPALTSGVTAALAAAAANHGKAVQVAPIKPTSRPPETQHVESETLLTAFKLRLKNSTYAATSRRH
jgi:hypothetical protein